jgi:hypothetical protein
LVAVIISAGRSKVNIEKSAAKAADFPKRKKREKLHWKIQLP